MASTATTRDPGCPRPRPLHGLRHDAETGAVDCILDDLGMPNGLAFTADESHPFVVDCHMNQIRRYRVVDGRHLDEGEVFAEGDTGPLDSLYEPRAFQYSRESPRAAGTSLAQQPNRAALNTHSVLVHPRR